MAQVMNIRSLETSKGPDNRKNRDPTEICEMKRFLALAIAVLMILSFASCASDKSGSDGSDTTAHPTSRRMRQQLLRQRTPPPHLRRQSPRRAAPMPFPPRPQSEEAPQKQPPLPTPQSPHRATTAARLPSPPSRTTASPQRLKQTPKR